MGTYWSFLGAGGVFTPYLPGVQVSAQKLWNPTWTNPVDLHQCLAVFPAEAVT